MYYLQSRYYNPDWGRFINADALGGSIGELLSHNMFAYCKNNPVNSSDPTGFKENELDWWDMDNHEGTDEPINPVPHVASFFSDFSPLDTIKDTIDLFRGKDSFTGESQNRWVLAAAVILPGALDGLVKSSAKTTAKFISKRTSNFVESYSKLPKNIQKAADKQFELFKQNPFHTSLNFEKLKGFDNVWSVRVQGKYRAYGRMEGGVMIWDDINAHDYKAIGR